MRFEHLFVLRTTRKRCNVCNDVGPFSSSSSICLAIVLYSIRFLLFSFFSAFRLFSAVMCSLVASRTHYPVTFIYDVRGILKLLCVRCSWFFHSFIFCCLFYFSVPFFHWKFSTHRFSFSSADLLFFIFFFYFFFRLCSSCSWNHITHTLTQ